MTTRRKKWPKGSLGWLIGVCLEQGTPKVIAGLEAHHRTMLDYQAHLLGGDYAEQRRGQQMSATLLRQMETLILLRRMDSEEMRRHWNGGYVKDGLAS